MCDKDDSERLISDPNVPVCGSMVPTSGFGMNILADNDFCKIFENQVVDVSKSYPKWHGVKLLIYSTILLLPLIYCMVSQIYSSSLDNHGVLWNFDRISTDPMNVLLVKIEDNVFFLDTMKGNLIQSQLISDLILNLGLIIGYIICVIIIVWFIHQMQQKEMSVFETNFQIMKEIYDLKQCESNREIHQKQEMEMEMFQELISVVKQKYDPNQYRK
ncbi:hypothetical protein [Methanorbis furvi]